MGAPQEERQLSPHRLLTLGSDGLLLVWRWAKQSRQLALVSGYRLTAESVPRNFRAGRARGDTLIGGWLSPCSLMLQCKDLVCVEFKTVVSVYRKTVKCTAFPAGTALSFPCEDSSLAVVGCENGCILKCSLHPNTDSAPGEFSVDCLACLYTAAVGSK